MKINISTAFSGCTDKNGGETIEFIRISHECQQSIALLRLAYDTVYVPAFPIESERDSLDLWDKQLSGDDPQTKLGLIIAGKHLKTQNPEIYALSAVNFFPEHQVGLMRYNVVTPAARKNNLGSIMVSLRKEMLLNMAHEENLNLQGIFVHCNDPERISKEDDVIDPALRIAIFEKMGAIRVPVKCILPPLLENEPVCDFMILMAYPHPLTGTYPSKSAIISHMKAIYANLAPLTDHSRSAHLSSVIDDISQLPQNWAEERKPLSNARVPKAP